VVLVVRWELDVDGQDEGSPRARQCSGEAMLMRQRPSHRLRWVLAPLREALQSRESPYPRRMAHVLEAEDLPLQRWLQKVPLLLMLKCHPQPQGLAGRNLLALSVLRLSPRM